MADLIVELIWSVRSRLAEGWANMADAFDELLCNFDSGESTMEVTTVLLVGWAIFCVLLVALGRYVNRRFLRPQDAELVETTEPAVKAPPEPAAAAAEPVAGKTAGAPAAAAAAPAPAATSAVAAPAKEKTVRRRDVSAVASRAPAPVSKAHAYDDLPPVPPLPKAPPKPKPVVLREVTPPTATGADKDAVRWVNALLRWLYVDPTPTPELHAKWIASLNQVAAKLAAENGIQLRFQEITSESCLPNLTNVMADPSPTEPVINILSDVESTALKFVVHVTRQMGEDFWSTEYMCDVETLSGPLSVVCEPEHLKGTVHFDCRPRIKLVLSPSPRTKLSDPMDEQALQAVVGEIVSNAVAHSSVDVDVSSFATCPRFARSLVIADPIIPVHYDSMIPTVPPTMSPKKIQKKGKRLFIKIVKAQNLGCDTGCFAPMCIAELDEPSQKQQTALSEGVNPNWDEQFLYELSNDTGEMLFEVWDKSPKEGKERFMGLGIVSIDDLIRNPSQRQLVPLQSRPYEGDDVSGALTVEFLFMDTAEVPRNLDREKPPRPPPPSPARTVNTNQTVSSDGTIVTKTTIQKQTKGVPDIVVNGEDTLTSTALRELSRPTRPLMTTEKSTLIIHSVQRDVPQVSVKVEKSKSGTWQEVRKPTEDGQSTDRELPRVSETAESSGTNDRSRPKERKSFMSTLKKRLSFRNKRSRSVDQQPESSSRDSSASRSASVDRAHSLPGSRADNLSARSSLSEVSGVSSSSAQTYIDEASMLVIEVIENGITKHYLIPGALASKSKWRKKGTKLHIYNDHTFVAKHLPSNITCEVCTKPFIRRIGKQGYECRDCQLKCHKPCHVRTDIRCPESRVGSMELEYVQEAQNEQQSKKTK